MDDPEVIQLRNRFLLGIFIALLFCVPLIVFLTKTYSATSALTRLRKNETFVMLIIKDDCSKCDVATDVLKKNKVKYSILNKDRNKNYDEIMKRISLENSEDDYPVMVYLKDGKMVANLFYITDDDMVLEFIKSYDLINSK